MSPTLQKATDIRRVQTTDDHTSCEIHVILRKKSFSSSLRFTTLLEWKARFVCYVNWQFCEPFLLIILWSIFAWLERVNIFGPYVNPGNFCRLNTQSTSMPPHRSFFSKSRYGRETNLYRRISMSCRPSLRANTVKLLLLIVVPDVSLSCLIVS